MTTDPARCASTVGSATIYVCAWDRSECYVSAAGIESGLSGEVVVRNRSESVPFPVRTGRRKACVRRPREVVLESPTSLALCCLCCTA